MSTLLAMIFSMSILGGCSPSNTDTGSTIPVGLYSCAPGCGAPSQLSRPEDSTHEAALPARTREPRRGAARRQRAKRQTRQWVPERVPMRSYLNNTPYGRR